MNRITKEGTVFEIGNYPWDESGFRPKSSVTASYDEKGFYFHFVSDEKNPTVKTTRINGPVYMDSCMEVFMKYAPDSDDRYINIEMNAGGFALSSVSKSRQETRSIPDEVIAEMLDIKPNITPDGWEVRLFVPKEYIEKYIPSYRHEKGAHLKGNFYKCGEITPIPHFGCFNNIVAPEPDFHRPECFADFVLD